MRDMIRFLFPLLISLFAIAGPAVAELGVKTVRYQLDGTTFEASIVHHPDMTKSLPGVLMVPNWMGPTAESLEKAKKVAGDGYVVMMVDMYGIGVRPQNGREAGAAAGVVRSDRELMRARAAKALAVFRSEADAIGLDPDRVAAIGFCFGGGTVLELGRSGADVDAVVSFHGDLASPTLEDDAAKTRAKVLVLHGAEDPVVPREDVNRFADAMLQTDVDWQLVDFGGAVHSFTNPGANSPGSVMYHERTAKRAFALMNALFAECWE